MIERIPPIYLPEAVKRYRRQLESDETHEPPPASKLGRIWAVLLVLFSALFALWLAAGLR